MHSHTKTSQLRPFPPATHFILSFREPFSVVFNFINLSACLHCKSTQIRPHNPVLQYLFRPILDPSVAQGEAQIFFFFMYSRGVQILKCSEDLRHHQHGNCHLGPCTDAAVFGHRCFSGMLGKKHLRRASVATGGGVTCESEDRLESLFPILNPTKKKKKKKNTWSECIENSRLGAQQREKLVELRILCPR